MKITVEAEHMIISLDLRHDEIIALDFLKHITSLMLCLEYHPNSVRGSICEMADEIREEEENNTDNA